MIILFFYHEIHEKHEKTQKTFMLESYGLS